MRFTTLVLSALFVCLVATAPRTAHADNSAWQLAGGGEWTEAANWSGGVPGAGDSAILLPNPTQSETEFTISSPVSSGGISFGTRRTYDVFGETITFDTLDPDNPAVLATFGSTDINIYNDILLASPLQFNGASGNNKLIELHGDFLSSDREIIVGQNVLPRLYGDNSAWTGDLNIHGGYLEAYSSTALGDTSGETHVYSGALGLWGGSAEKVTVEYGANVYLLQGNAFYDNDIHLRGGGIAGRDDNAVPILRGNVTFENGMYIGVSPGSGSAFDTEFQGNITGIGSIIAAYAEGTISGDISTPGDFLVWRGSFDPIRFQGEIDIAGDIAVSVSRVQFNNPGGAFNNKVLLTEGYLDVQSDYTLGTVVLDTRSESAGSNRLQHFDLQVDPGNTLTIGDELQWYGGAIRGNVQGVSDLVKRTGNNAWLDGTAGAGFQTVTVEDNLLTLMNDHGATAAEIHLGQGYLAGVLASNTGVYQGDIYLHNSRNNLALESFGNSVLAGNIYLGDVGGSIGDANVTGQIHGGTLYKHDGHAYIRSGGHTYTGDTVLMGWYDTNLIDSGRLESTSGVVLQRFGYLQLDNRGTTAMNDRIDDSVPLSVESGTLRLYGREGQAVSETIGSFHASRGLALVEVETSSVAGSTTTLLLDSVQRETGAAVAFDRTGTGSKILFGTAPTLDDGIIGGWATHGTRDFATYGPNGVVAYRDLYTAHGDINTATATDTVYMEGFEHTLTSDRTVNAYAVRGVDLDLDGHTLTLDSGALLTSRTTASEIYNGNLTSGTNELIFNAPDGGATNIGANIIDGAAGPMDLTIVGDSGSFALSGVNTYSGDTYMARGTTRIMSRDSLPQGGNLYLNGGTLHFEFSPLLDENDEEVPLAFDQIHINNDARFLTSGNSRAVNANQYLVEDGDTFGEFVGNGELVKTTRGRFKLGGDSQRWTGAIDIQEGILEVNKSEALGMAPLEDAHAITIGPRGILQLQNASILERKVILNGGEIYLSNGRLYDTSLIDVREDSTIRGANVDAPIIGSADLTFVVPTTSGESPVRADFNNFDGNVNFSGGAVLIDNVSSDYTGTVRTSAWDFRLQNGGALAGANIIVEENGTLTTETTLQSAVRLENAALRMRGNAATLAAPLTVSGDSYVYIADFTLTNIGYAQLNSSVTLEDNASLRFMPDAKLAFQDWGPYFNRSAVIRGDVYVGADTEIIAYDGNVTIEGDVVSTSTFSSLNLVGPRDFTLYGGVRLEGGSLSLTHNGAPVSIALGGAANNITGSGTIVANIQLSGGSSIAPGNSPGLITIEGETKLLAGSTFYAELAGDDITEYDRVVSTGALTLGGKLELSLINGYDPAVGAVYDLVSGSSRSGKFSDTNGVVIDSQRALALTYTNKGVELRTSLRGDVNFDDDVDANDLAVIFDRFNGVSGVNRTWATGDNDGDLDVDTLDVAIAMKNYNTGEEIDPSLGPQLRYDPESGNLRMFANGQNITSFYLEGEDAFIRIANYADLNGDVGEASTMTDRTLDLIGWVSAEALAGEGFDGFEGTTRTYFADLGNILPDGLDQGELDSLFTTNLWSGPGGEGSFAITVRQTPEPGSLALLMLGLVSLGVGRGLPWWRKRRNTA